MYTVSMGGSCFSPVECHDAGSLEDSLYHSTCKCDVCVGQRCLTEVFCDFQQTQQ